MSISRRDKGVAGRDNRILQNNETQLHAATETDLRHHVVQSIYGAFH